MGKKSEAVALIEKKLNNETFLSYKEIAEVCDYHPKYILRLKISNNFSIVYDIGL